MAIVIPSKNIFEISSSPIKKNIINTVEIPTKTISTVYEYDTVVFSTNNYIAITDIINIDDNKINQDTAGLQFPDGNDNFFSFEKTANAIIIKKKYKKINSFTFPKTSNNKAINKLKQVGIEVNCSIDYYNNIPCSYDPYNNTFDVTTTLSPTKSTVQNSLQISDINETYTLYNGYSNITIKNDNENNINFKVINKIYGANVVESISIKTENTMSIFNTATIIDNGDNYLVEEFNVFCGYDISLCYASAKSQEKKNDFPYPQIWQDVIANQIRYDVQPLYITLNVYGDIVKLDIQDSTVKVGNGKNTTSLDGNELIQSTNTYNSENAIEKFAQQVLNEYKDGKATATIRVSISDYFDENGYPVIGTKTNIGYTSFIRFLSMQKIENKYNIIFEGNFTNNTYAIKYKNEIANIEKSGLITYSILVDENSEFYKDYSFYSKIEVTALVKLKGLFTVGDEVIPYIYTAYRKDVPLSVDKAGNAKVFTVVGEKPYYDGAVLQELTLQEKKYLTMNK